MRTCVIDWRPAFTAINKTMWKSQRTWIRSVSMYSKIREKKNNPPKIQKVKKKLFPFMKLNAINFHHNRLFNVQCVHIHVSHMDGRLETTSELFKFIILSPIAITHACAFHFLSECNIRQSDFCSLNHDKDKSRHKINERSRGGAGDRRLGIYRVAVNGLRGTRAGRHETRDFWVKGCESTHDTFGFKWLAAEIIELNKIAANEKCKGHHPKNIFNCVPEWKTINKYILTARTATVCVCVVHESNKFYISAAWH